MFEIQSIHHRKPEAPCCRGSELVELTTLEEVRREDARTILRQR